jgi:hypothetical protein
MLSVCKRNTTDNSISSFGSSSCLTYLVSIWYLLRSSRELYWLSMPVPPAKFQVVLRRHFPVHSGPLDPSLLARDLRTGIQLGCAETMKRFRLRSICTMQYSKTPRFDSSLEINDYSYGVCYGVCYASNLSSEMIQISARFP